MHGADSENERPTPVEGSERARKAKLINEVDLVSLSPGARAQRVLDVLRTNQNLNTWDVVCFCSEYLGFMIPVFPWLEQDAQRLAKLIYTAHYEHFGATLPQEAERKI